jgi:uncharacterized metal-binding protein
MSAAGGCGCSGGQTSLILACSGASNLGQITNSLALRLTQEGVGKMSCLAGVGAHISGFVVSAKDSESLVVLDGCAQLCAHKVVEHVGAKPLVSLILTEHGFVKHHGAGVSEEELEKAYALCMVRLKEAACSTAS